jgi:hypothetical protein
MFVNLIIYNWGYQMTNRRLGILFASAVFIAFCFKGYMHYKENNIPIFGYKYDNHTEASARQPTIDEGRAKEGLDLHLRILSKHPKIDYSYAHPLLNAALTDNPLVAISVPIDDWNSISTDERNLLCEYAASLVSKVRSDPFTYSKVPPEAPAASMIRRNVSMMTSKSWGILAGRISEDGRDIYSDRIVKAGK